MVRGDRDGWELDWSEYKCWQNCWWDAVTCDGRSWSFCRVPYGSDRVFSGLMSDSRIEGTQSYSFYVLDGDAQPDSRDVQLVFSYDLRR